MSFITRTVALALTLLPLVASANPLRTMDGQTVSLTDDSAATAVVFWSVDCTACNADIAELEQSGARVVIVNTDPATERAQIRPTLRRLGLQSPVVSDLDGQLQTELNMRDAHGVVVLAGGETRETTARQTGCDFATETVLAATAPTTNTWTAAR